MRLLPHTCPSGGKERGVPASSLSAAVTREKGKAMPRDAAITQGMRQGASLQPGTACHSAARHGGTTPRLPPPPPLPAPTAGHPRPTTASGGSSGAAAAAVQHR